MKKKDGVRKQPWHKKPRFGSLYVMKGSKYIYISLNYFKQRLRFPTDLEDTPKNWDQLCEFMEKVGQRIKNRTFVFAKSFYWLDDATKSHFTKLEGGDYKPEPEHVLFGEYAENWMARKIPAFASISKQSDYANDLRSRILTYFEKMPFAAITSNVVQTFIENLERCNGSKKPLSIKRIKNIMIPMSKIWGSACNDHSWTLHNPFSDISEKYKEIEDKELQEKERQSALMMMNSDSNEGIILTRDVFLMSEWEQLLKAVDPHYHPVMELLLRGVIASELEALQKRHIKDNVILICCAVIRKRYGKVYMKFKPKNWYRKREIPLTNRLKALTEQAAAASTSSKIMSFELGIEIPAHDFLLTMKDGSPFKYSSFRKTVWDKAIKHIGLDSRVPYASRHTFVQWSLLIGVNKNRMVDLMGHSTKKMIDECYGFYRKGLIDEKQKILDYLGDDFLALEEMRISFPERYREKMAMTDKRSETVKAPVLAATFCQSFGQSQGLRADNYM